MDNKEAIRLEDGRRADRVVREELNDAGEAVTVTELFVEPKIEKKLAKRIVEYTRPVIHRREIETVDEATGEVVEKKVESIDPSVKMELREHVVSTPKLEAESYVTRTELKDLLLSLKANPIVVQSTPTEEAQKFFEVEPKKAPIQSAQELTEKRNATKSGLSLTTIVLGGLIVAELIGGVVMWFYW